MSNRPLDRRQFLGLTAVTALSAGCQEKKYTTSIDDFKPKNVEDRPLVGPPAPYRGPNVILVRFGGGVRRRETIAYPDQTWCPFILHTLGGKGVIFNNVEIANAPGVETSHGQGTLYLLTGQYDHYTDIYREPFKDRFEPKVPTIFEYLRRDYAIPEHQAVIINGEDRVGEEFYTFSNNHIYGVRYRSVVLSLFRFKNYLLRKELAEGKFQGEEREKRRKQLEKLESHDYRVQGIERSNKHLDAFWEDWRRYYGRSGLVNPRGDRVLTTLALRAMKQLQPRLMMVNYQDPDYVHWGNPNFYTRAIAIIDDGVREIYEAAQADPFYRNNTVFVVVPDCGRDDNRLAAVPYQHHFNSKSAHEIFAIVAGAGIGPAARVCEKKVQQISVPRTIAEIMGISTPHIAVEPLPV